MQASKHEFSQSVVSNICRLSRLLFNIHNEENLVHIFGLNKTGLELTISKIIDGFPDDYFIKLSPPQLREMESILAKEFVFFQVQEKDNAKNYQNLLHHFSEIFIRDMRMKIKIKKNDTLKEGE